MSSDPDALVARITELETKLSFAEDQVDGLNSAVYRQQQQIDALAQEVSELRQQLHSGQPGEPLSLRDELSPHY